MEKWKKCCLTYILSQLYVKRAVIAVFAVFAVVDHSDRFRDYVSMCSDHHLSLIINQ